jgi:hypothetical protein
MTAEFIFIVILLLLLLFTTAATTQQKKHKRRDNLGALGTDGTILLRTMKA